MQSWHGLQRTLLPVAGRLLYCSAPPPSPRQSQLTRPSRPLLSGSPSRRLQHSLPQLRRRRSSRMRKNVASSPCRSPSGSPGGETAAEPAGSRVPQLVHCMLLLGMCVVLSCSRWRSEHGGMGEATPKPDRRRRRTAPQSAAPPGIAGALAVAQSSGPSFFSALLAQAAPMAPRGAREVGERLAASPTPAPRLLDMPVEVWSCIAAFLDRTDRSAPPRSRSPPRRPPPTVGPAAAVLAGSAWQPPAVCCGSRRRGAFFAPSWTLLRCATACATRRRCGLRPPMTPSSRRATAPACCAAATLR